MKKNFLPFFIAALLLFLNSCISHSHQELSSEEMQTSKTNSVWTFVGCKSGFDTCQSTCIFASAQVDPKLCNPFEPNNENGGLACYCRSGDSLTNEDLVSKDIEAEKETVK